MILGTWINLILLIVFVGIIAYAVIYLINMLPMPAPFKQIAKVLIIIVCLLLLLQQLQPLTHINLLQ